MNDREALNRVLDLLNQEMDTRQQERDEAVRRALLARPGTIREARREREYRYRRVDHCRRAQGVLQELLLSLPFDPPATSTEAWPGPFVDYGPPLRDEETPDPRRVGFDLTESGLRISTVQLPPGFMEGEGAQYETMVFPSDSWLDLDVETYQTREDAVAGHERMVEKWRDHVYTPQED